MKLYVSIPALLAAGFLSACGSTNSTPANQFEEVIGFLAASDEEGAVQEVNAEDLPDNATMNGYLAASSSLDGSSSAYVGDATADFNFANSTLSGTASNFNEYQVAEACAEGFEGCTGEKTRALDGSLDIVGGINGTSFYYDTNGQLTAEDDELGTLTANVYLSGEGYIGTFEDKLTAVGTGGDEGNSFANIFGEEGYIGRDYLDHILILQE